jgi:hypothetical protein
LSGNQTLAIATPKDHPPKNFQKNGRDLAGSENPLKIPVKVLNK